MVGCMGNLIMVHVQQIVSLVLSKDSTIQEMIDFLAFVGLIIFKYKPDIMVIVDGIFSALIERIFFFLGMVATGTDDLLSIRDLKRAYLGFLLAILNNGMEDVFTSGGIV